MTTALRLAALLSLVPALAQGQSLALDPSQALACLSPQRELRGQPEYPFDLWKRGEKGRFKVALVFDDATSRPTVTVVERDGDSGFESAVKAHVRDLRVPCLTTGSPAARIEIEYVFYPERHKVAASDPVDTDRAAQDRMFKCLKHESGSLQIPYPEKARREDLQGHVLLELQFDSADGPPRFKVYATEWNKPLARALEQFASGIRLPCYEGRPVDLPIDYFFQLEGTSAYGFKEITFNQFLSSVKGIREQKLDFDFTTMGCPFNLRLTYLRPYRRNKVVHLDNYDPAREPFVEWLRNAELSLTVPALNSVFGDNLTLPVPCARLNLNP